MHNNNSFKTLTSLTLLGKLFCFLHSLYTFLKTAVDFRASLRFPRACLGQAASSFMISHGHPEGKKRPQAAPVLSFSELNEPLSLFVVAGASSASPVGSPVPRYSRRTRKATAAIHRTKKMW